MSDLELRSQLYAWLGDRTSKPDGDAHDHESLLAASRDLAALVEARVPAADNQRAAEEVHAAAEALDRDPVIADLVSRRAAGAAVDAAVTLVATRAAALASPAPARADALDPQ